MWPEAWALLLAKRRIYRRTHPNKREWNRKADLKKNYGKDFTVERWNEIFVAQGSCCAVCKAPTSGRKTGVWCTDHDHNTGQVRGILCNGCNVALGQVKDDPLRLRLLAEYLEDRG